VTDEREELEVRLGPVDAATWRDVADLEVAPEQRAFVAEPSRYLALCAYDGLWTPLAIRAGDTVVGMLMWAVDPGEGAVWLGGVLVDRRWQRRGIGRRAVRAAIELLSRQEETLDFALSYEPENQVARRTYATLGFVETGETQDDEVVARLRLDGWP
jgi:diamine N-acetyltransferase